MQLTLKQFQDCVPSLHTPRAQLYLPHLDAALVEYEINTPARIAAFLAQVLHESGSFRYAEEIADGDAYDITVNPKLAAKLGNDKPGDGPKYKGRGWIQLTGKSNYRAAGKAFGVDLESNPKLASDPEFAFRVAAWFWKKNGLNELADVSNFREITRRINGGFNGLDDRMVHWNRCKIALNVK